MTDIREETNTQENAQDSEARTLTERPPLPMGSTVLECVLKKNEENGDFELAIQGVLVGTDEFDPSNPCHRFLAIVCERLPDMMDAIGGTSVERVSAIAANDATVGTDTAQG
jgi:hypothetical protein